MKSSCSFLFLLYGLLDVDRCGEQQVAYYTIHIYILYRLTAFTYLRCDIDSSDKSTSLVFISSAGVLWKYISVNATDTKTHVVNTDSWNKTQASREVFFIFITHISTAIFIRIMRKRLVHHSNNTAPNKGGCQYHKNWPRDASYLQNKKLRTDIQFVFFTVCI